MENGFPETKEISKPTRQKTIKAPSKVIGQLIEPFTNPAYK